MRDSDFREFVIDLLPITFRSVSAVGLERPRGSRQNPRGRGQTHEAEAEAEAEATTHEAEAEAEARFFGLEAEARPRGLTSLAYNRPILRWTSEVAHPEFEPVVVNNMSTTPLTFKDNFGFFWGSLDLVVLLLRFMFASVETYNYGTLMKAGQMYIILVNSLNYDIQIYSTRALWKKGGDLEQIATEWISTEMHSNHHVVSVEPKRPHLYIVEFFLSSLEVSMNFHQKWENMN